MIHRFIFESLKKVTKSAWISSKIPVIFPEQILSLIHQNFIQ